MTFASGIHVAIRELKPTVCESAHLEIPCLLDVCIILDPTTKYIRQ
jgi:hypothetical protein